MLDDDNQLQEAFFWKNNQQYPGLSTPSGGNAFKT